MGEYQLDRLPQLILGWTGNHAGITEVGRQGLVRLRRERPLVVSELLRDAITLAGPYVRELLQAGAMNEGWDRTQAYGRAAMLAPEGFSAEKTLEGIRCSGRQGRREACRGKSFR